jgi:hypothetical protein
MEEAGNGDERAELHALGVLFQDLPQGQGPVEVQRHEGGLVRVGRLETHGELDLLAAHHPHGDGAALAPVVPAELLL